LYRIDVLSGEVVPIVAGPSAGFRPQGVWSKEGKAIFYSRGGGLWSRDLDTNREVEIFRKPAGESPGSGRNLALSRDGQWLAFGDRRVLMVVPSSGGDPHELMRLQSGEEGSFSGLEWAGDGRHLLFSIGDAIGMTPELWRISVDGGKPEKTGLATQRWATLAVHPDGRQVAFTAGETKQEVWVMENVLPSLSTVR
jgi:Tol biopolymer transport system component